MDKQFNFELWNAKWDIVSARYSMEEALNNIKNSGYCKVDEEYVKALKELAVELENTFQAMNELDQFVSYEILPLIDEYEDGND